MKWKITLLIALYVGSSQAQQNDMTRILGSQDRDVPVPAVVLPLGRQDAAALEAIIDFVKATNGGTWNGMRATGTITGSEENTTNSATLTVGGGDDFRLDVSAPEGERSIRIHGNIGQIQESDGQSHRLPLATAANGLLAFPKLLDSSFPTAQTSLLDRGLVSIEGKALRRITIETPLDVTGGSLSPAQISLVDLYFDPASGLLIKSVSSAQLDSADRERYVLAVTYGDYRKVDSLLLPLTLSQTLNGQRQWSLQLTDVHLQPVVDAHYFQF